MKFKVRLILLSLAVVASLVHAAEGERVSTLQDQQQVAVTIYNDDLALIRDSRRVDLVAGDNALAWRDVSAQMRPETALLRNLTSPQGFRLVEQNFDFDLLTPQKLIEKYVGRKIQVIKTNPATGAETVEEGTVLSANEGIVVQFADRVESHPPGRLAFKAVPDNLRDRPTLVVHLQAATGGAQNLELAYLTSGLGWKADYVAELSDHDDHLDLDGWVTLTNRSGTTYRDAQMQLVAGDVNRVTNLRFMRADAVGTAAVAPASAAMREETLLEFHLYSLDRPTNIEQNQTKQVSLLSAVGVPVRKELVLSGGTYYYIASYGEIGQKLKVDVFAEFDNKGQGLGVPLPKGVIRVYKKDSHGQAQFVGEDNIDHTPKNETVRIRLGHAFDVTADKKQTAFQKIPRSERHDYIYEVAFDILLKNAKKEAVTVKVMEPIPGDWEMLSETRPHTKVTSNTAVWNVTVPAEGHADLSYRVRVKF